MRGMEGWLKLHRKIRQNPIFNDMELFRLWIICLTEATHKPHKQMVGKQVVELQPGEFITGRFDLQNMFNNGLKGEQQKTPYTVWRWLLKLEETEYLSIKTSNKFTIVTVKNWDIYQGVEQQNEQQMSNKRATDEQQVSTNKNVKNDKNVENVKNELNTYTGEFEKFWTSYPRKIGKKDCFKTWTRLLKNGESVDLLIKCAENYSVQCTKLKTEERFIKHPKTFLNEERYKDHEKEDQENEINNVEPFRPRQTPSNPNHANYAAHPAHKRNQKVANIGNVRENTGSDLNVFVRR